MIKQRIPLPYVLRQAPYVTMMELEVDLENHTWVTANGSSIPVRQMKVSHILNCINCWNGKGRSHLSEGYLGGRTKWLRIFEEELIRRQ